MSRYDAIAAEFDALGIERTAPGFYDHPAFVAQEHQDSRFLERYAHYVASLPLDANYVAKVRREAPLIARIVHDELVADGRLGACVDVGMMLSRILEREGIWNCLIKGSVTIDFSHVADIPTQYYWSVDVHGGFAAAHSWLVVPPFSVVDVALKQQPYRRGREYVPALILTECRDSAEPQIERIVSPEIRARFFRRYGADKWAAMLAKEMVPAWLRTRTALPAVTVIQNGLTLVYDAVAVAAPDAPFEQMTGWKVHGRSGISLYTELVKPALDQLRHTLAT